MEAFYNVAGFQFCLKMPDDSILWKRMENYAPFKSEIQSVSQDCIFTLELCDELPGIDAAVLVFKDAPEDPGMPRTDILSVDGNFLFDFYPNAVSGCASRLVVSPDFRQGRMSVCKDGARSLNGRLFGLNNALMLMFTLSTADKMTLEMHASVTVDEGTGYLFLGKSGTGKSTHSRLWMDNIPGTSLLNDDNPVVRVMPDGSVRVFGTPWSGKTPCYINADYPAGGFVQLNQYKENRIRPMELFEAYSSLYSSSSGMKMDERMSDLLHLTLEKVLEKVPCWYLDCLPDAAAALLCHKTIADGNAACSE